MVCEPPLLAVPDLCLQSIDQIDNVEEAVARTVADKGPVDVDGQMRLPGSGAADQHDIAPICSRL